MGQGDINRVFVAAVYKLPGAVQRIHQPEIIRFAAIRGITARERFLADDGHIWQCLTQGGADILFGLMIGNGNGGAVFFRIGAGKTGFVEIIEESMEILIITEASEIGAGKGRAFRPADAWRSRIG